MNDSSSTNNTSNIVLTRHQLLSEEISQGHQYSSSYTIAFLVFPLKESLMSLMSLDFTS